MPKGKANPYWGILDLSSSVAAEEVVWLGNLESINKPLWAEVVKEPPEVSTEHPEERDQEKLALGWLVWDRERRMLGKRDLAKAQVLHQSVRTALDAIVRGDEAALERVLNVAGPFQCCVTRKSPKRLPKASTASGLGWNVSWMPSDARSSEAAVTTHLLSLLTFADRLGRCEQCDQFFLSERRWKRPPRFCENACSVRFHNLRRRDYFRERQRERRARQSASAQ